MLDKWLDKVAGYVIERAARIRGSRGFPFLLSMLPTPLRAVLQGQLFPGLGCWAWTPITSPLNPLNQLTDSRNRQLYMLPGPLLSKFGYGINSNTL